MTQHRVLDLTEKRVQEFTPTLGRMVGHPLPARPWWAARGRDYMNASTEGRDDGKGERMSGGCEGTCRKAIGTARWLRPLGAPPLPSPAPRASLDGPSSTPHPVSCHGPTSVGSACELEARARNTRASSTRATRCHEGKALAERHLAARIGER